jgi:hypothetical protein
MHLTDTDLGVVLDPATDGTGAASAHAHAATCANCHGAIRLARAADRDVADLLHLLDHATPLPDFASVARRATAPEHGLALATDDRPTAHGPSGSHAAPRRVGRTWSMLDWRTRSSTRTADAIRWSAVVLSLSAAAAAALPSVRHFVAHVAGLSHATAPVDAPIARSSTPSPTDAPVQPRGVAILADGRAELVFRTAQPGSVARVRPALGTKVAVTASIDGSTYTVGRRTIIVDSGAPGTAYDIELPSPAGLPEVSIRIGDRMVFVRHGATVSTGGAMQADGSYTISLSPDSPSGH